MPTLNSFTQAGKFAQKVVSKRFNEMAMDMYSELVEATPVCTGFASASWYITPQIPKTKNENSKEGMSRDCVVQFRAKDLNLEK